MIVFACASHFLCHIYVLILPAVLPLVIEEFSQGYFSIGVIANIAYLFFGFGALVAGPLVDRVGGRRVAAIFLLGAPCASILVAMASSVYLFAFGLLILGASASLYHPAGLALLSRSTSRTGHAMGLHGMAGNMGLACAPVVAGSIAAIWGWRAAYGILAVPGFALGLASWRLRFSDDHADRSMGEGESLRTWFRENARSPVWLLFGVGVLAGVSYRGLMTFLPTYLGELYAGGGATGSGVAVGGVLATGALLLGVVGQYIGGRASDSFRPERLLFLAILVSLPFMAMVGFGTGPWILAWAALFSFFHFSGQPITNLLLSKYTDERFRGRIYGLYFTASFGLGSFGASLCGYLADTYGLAWIFRSLVILILVSLGLSGLLLRRRRSIGGQSS